MLSLYLFVIIVVLMFSNSNSFTISSSSNSNNNLVRVRSKGGQLTMGNNAKFGIFSPAVIVAKTILGEAKLNKVSNSKNYFKK